MSEREEERNLERETRKADGKRRLWERKIEKMPCVVKQIYEAYTLFYTKPTLSLQLGCFLIFYQIKP